MMKTNTTFNSPLYMALAREAASRCTHSFWNPDAITAVVMAYTALEAFLNEVAQLAVTLTKQDEHETLFKEIIVGRIPPGMGELAPNMERPPNEVEDAALRKLVSLACEKSSGAIDQQRETKDALSGIGFKMPGKGSSRGAPMGQPGPRRLAARLAGDDRLRRIALLAGRFKRIAARKQRAKVSCLRRPSTTISQCSGRCCG